MNKTRIVLLGTGNPNPDPNHAGPSLAIVVEEIPYIIDFGAGLVRQAARMSPQYGGNIPALDAKNLKKGFLTHLHSDHTVGYPDFILTPWVMERDQPLEVYGPRGTQALTNHILSAYKEDIHYRLYGLEPANDWGWRVDVHEIDDGVIYTDQYVTVEAFSVCHGTWPNAFGFRFQTPDKLIVISGDTAPCDNIRKYSAGADILIHEVYYEGSFNRMDPIWRRYHASHHTSTKQLAKLAQDAKPGLLVLYHVLFWGATKQEILDEIADTYPGPTVIGEDLFVID
jgi:ribonuclease BN (tRNA processing enzyme)